MFDGQLQQLSAGWEQQLLEAQYSHEALNSARERAEQQVQEVKADCQHWQEHCERLLASQDSMSKQHSQLEEVLASTTTQLRGPAAAAAAGGLSAAVQKHQRGRPRCQAAPVTGWLLAEGS